MKFFSGPHKFIIYLYVKMFHFNGYHCNEICKNKIFKHDNKHFTKSAATYVRQRQRGKEKEITKDHKGMLISENYKNVHNGHSLSVLSDKPH